MDPVKEIENFYYEVLTYKLATTSVEASENHVNYNSLLYFDLITHHKNCTPSYLSKVLNISNGAVTIKINELIRQGFVKQTRSDSDRRLRHLTLTPKALECYCTFKRRLFSITINLKKYFSDEEINTFCLVAQNISQVCNMYSYLSTYAENNKLYD